jgi:hypothetical protein
MTTDHESPDLEHGDDLGRSSEEDRLLRSLYEEHEPDRALEERIVTDWRRLEHTSRRPLLRPIVQIAALLVTFIAGTRLGSGAPEPPRVDAVEAPQVAATGLILEPRFAFLIYTDADVDRIPAGAEAEVVREYTNWAREIRGSGREVTGERLLDENHMVAAEGSDQMGSLELGGYFIVQAGDFDEAVELAQGHPHVRRGGFIEVRPIGPS